MRYEPIGNKADSGAGPGYLPRANQQPAKQYGIPMQTGPRPHAGSNPLGRPLAQGMPLSPKRASASNVQPLARTASGLLDTIGSHATQLSRVEMHPKMVLGFDEADLDEEIDMDFDAPIIKPGASIAVPVTETPNAARGAATPAVAEAQPVVIKGKRKLPWQQSAAQKPYGILAQPLQTPAKASALDMSASAMKLGKKELLSKKKGETAVAKAMQVQATTGRVDLAKVFLSTEQQRVVQMIKAGKSVFFTGSAGTGKSVLMREAIKELKRKYGASEQVAVCASTGLAACNIGGVTLHSFSGTGIGQGKLDDLVKSIKKNKRSISRWTKVKVLIIDEISMIDAIFFDKLEAIARMLRKNDKPWGGIQLVCTGDFFQLPPVQSGGDAKFAFESNAWKKIDHTIALQTVFRQKDGEFVTMLNEMRTGNLSPSTVQGFRDLQRPLAFEDGILPTELFPTRAEVERANATRMRMLPGEVHNFQAEDSGGHEDSRTRLLENCMAPKELSLKQGAQVMLIKNQSEYLVNGSLGRIVGFMNDRTYTQYLDDADGTFRQDLFEDSPWNEADLADESIASERKRIKLAANRLAQAGGKVWPLVKFTVPGSGDVIQLISPELWKFELPNGEIQAQRKQVPLILAYAISIHKAQGQTIERVKVDLRRVFEKGQAYVALSRAVSKEGLQILNFEKEKVMAHPKVAAFYRLLERQSISAQDDEEDMDAVEAQVSARTALPLLSTQQVFDQARRDPVRAYAGATKKVTGWGAR